MNFLMANFTDRSNIQPMFFSVAEIMMVFLCLFFAQNTHQRRWFRKSVISDLICDCIFCLKSLWIFCVVFFTRNQANFSSFFGFTVHLLSFSILWCLSKNFMTQFTIGLQFVFGSIKSTYTKFVCRFDYLATGTSFGYSLVSHIRSFLTGLVKAAVGVRPVCGLSIISDGSF